DPDYSVGLLKMSKAELQEKLEEKLRDWKDLLPSGNRQWQQAETWPGREGSEYASCLENREFNFCIRGRQLTDKELGQLAVQIGSDLQTVLRWAHLRVLKGWGEWILSIRPEGKRWRCQRCGEMELEEWPGIGSNMATCRSCSSLGVSSSQQVLYRDKQGLERKTEAVSFFLQPALTAAQEGVSSQVLEFVSRNKEKEALLWAACGAGKTEVCFPSAAWALENGKSVLFAAPRQDVINDIAPRLQRNFPELQIQILAGMIPVKYQKGNLVLATTHQILRFYRAFDLIFLDEMDAFPYHGNRMLEWGLVQALSSEGKIVYLTATPSEEGLRKNNQAGRNLFRLPARHHRYPLPVPRWRKFSYQPQKPGFNRIMEKELQEAVSRGITLIFVPQISWVGPLVRYLELKFPQWRIAGSYSSDPDRKQKIEDLKQGQYCLFVCTSILERGVTIPNAQVLVLAADHPIFEKRALIQMAGRAGRTKEYPGGLVLLVAARKTAAVTGAISWIREQNNYAASLGLLDLR
ncbi:MAG TPA: DEAD/DEAH box helicase family protein, partial [Desulfitobacteriaceae bacterium]|nr:DEAD/DEAH box helicase family protein [Desulfitobacteriaceae bacterium]